MHDFFEGAIKMVDRVISAFFRDRRYGFAGIL